MQLPAQAPQPSKGQTPSLLHAGPVKSANINSAAPSRKNRYADSGRQTQRDPPPVAGMEEGGDLEEGAEARSACIIRRSSKSYVTNVDWNPTRTKVNSHSSAKD